MKNKNIYVKKNEQEESKNDLEVKDELYYSDLMYKLRSLAGIEQQKNEETEDRIIEREKSIVEEQETGPFRYLNKLSIFQEELFEIVSGISKKAGVTFRSLSVISKYPELVNEALAKLEIKKNSIETKNKNILVNDGPKLVKKRIPSKNNGNK